MRLRTALWLWWHRLWIRKEEFHHSLSMDAEALMEMHPDESDKYIKDLVRRRMIAHERGMTREAAEVGGK